MPSLVLQKGRHERRACEDVGAVTSFIAGGISLPSAGVEVERYRLPLFGFVMDDELGVGFPRWQCFWYCEGHSQKHCQQSSPIR